MNTHHTKPIDTDASVAVVMCTYNGARYLRPQLDSILAQTYPLKEIIIQDDGSSDETVAICEEYAQRHSIVKVYRNAQNLGFNLNFQTACQRVTARFVAISDQDDIWFPEKIERLLSTIGQHDIAFSSHLRGADREHAHAVTPNYHLPALLFGGFAGHTMLLRTDFVQRQDVWIPCIFYDWSLAVKAWTGQGIVRLDEPLGWHRSHAEEVCVKANAQYYAPVSHPTWQPYLQGFRHFRKLQRNDNWQRFYGTIARDTSTSHEPLAHRLATLMQRRSLWATARLCWLTMKHRREVYPHSGNADGAMGVVRGFCLPFIFSYQNTQFFHNR